MIRALHTNKGFTLIELMIVVAIIGILAAIAIPNFLRFQAKSKQAEAKTNLGAIGTTAESYRAERDAYVVSAVSDLGWAPQGTPRYNYFYDVLGTAMSLGGATGTSANGCDRDVAPAGVANSTGTLAAPTGNFLAGAAGDVDTDATCDWWTYSNARVLTNVAGQNDVSD